MMNEADRKRLAVAVGTLGEAYGRAVTKVTIKAYEIGLAGLPIAAIEHAARRAIAERRFMPVPSELRELAGVMSPEDRAILAWGAVAKAVARHGYYDSVDFDDKIINAAIRNLGGWTEIAVRFNEEEEKWARKDFERVYISMMRSGVNAEHIGYLSGFFEQDNRGRGFEDHVPQVELIATGLPPHAPGMLPQPPKTQRRIGGTTKLIGDATASIGGMEKR